MDLIQKTITELTRKGLLRSPQIIEAMSGSRVRINREEKIVLCSNDYLGLTQHAHVKEAMIRGVAKYGAGAGGARLVSGTTQAHAQLEQALAIFKQAESALLFNSGWHLNTGVIPALARRGDDIFADRLSHASIIDGCLLSRANLTRYPHSDVNSLEDLLKKSTAKNRLIITDSVFSMDGDVAPLKVIIGLAEKYGATVYIDDAHGVGALGENGRGTLEHCGLGDSPSPHVIELGTLGKAFGSCGAFITGSNELIKYLTNKARSFIYSTALPPGVCTASLAALEIIQAEPERRERLRENADFIRTGLNQLGLDTLKSETQIIPVIIGSAEETMHVASRLLTLGVFVQGIRPPTVPEGTSRLRITVTSEHTRAELETVLGAIKTAIHTETTVEKQND